jgi:hypothetical protein
MAVFARQSIELCAIKTGGYFMSDAVFSEITARLRRLERQNRQNRILIVLLCAALGVASIAATKAAPNVVIADDVRSHRFTLLDPNGGVADDWYTNNRNPPESFSGFEYHAP